MLIEVPFITLLLFGFEKSFCGIVVSVTRDTSLGKYALLFYIVLKSILSNAGKNYQYYCLQTAAKIAVERKNLW
jgi:hypothetical protein